MPRHVLVVCVGNICRSPMAAALLRAALEPDFSVGSAGIGALVGEPADPLAEELLRACGLSIEDHVARQLDEKLLVQSDLIITMEGKQVDWIESQWPQARGRVFKWGHWRGFEVPDPYRRGRDAFTESLNLIQEGIDDWVQRLKQL